MTRYYGSSFRLVLLAIAVLLGVSSGSAIADPPATYYNSVDASSSATLRQTLHEVIDDHKRFPYTSSSTDTWNILEAADQDPNDASNILGLYRNASVTKHGRGNSFYNREHSWPKSYGFPNDNSKNYPYTDCHHLFLTDSNYNSSRSNKPYRSCDSSCNERPTEMNDGSGGGTGVHPGNSNWTKAGAWETWIGRRGEVARALFYLDVRYEGGTHGGTNVSEPDLVLTDNEALISASKTGNNENTAHMGMLSVLLTWHDQDPVDDRERARNDAIFPHQKNRNPFIDHPEWVDCVFRDQCGTTPTATNTVWINEIHYDNVGADQGEFVEIAGAPGTNLTGWMLVGYNGNTTNAYKTVQLADSIPDQGGGIGTLAFDFGGLQNGAADGIALVDSSGAVIEFLSYEGAFVGGNGPAHGILATDIGVSESGTTASGDSLQRSGTGAAASSFSWQAPAASTRGELNANQGP